MERSEPLAWELAGWRRGIPLPIGAVPVFGHFANVFFQFMFREHFLNIADQDAWERYLPADRSVFGSLGYARIYEAFRRCSPRLYVVDSNEAVISYPLLLRSLKDLPFQVDTKAKWDTTTPNFTGPLMSGSDSKVAAAFPDLRNALFRGEGIVAEFAHLHPWSQFATILKKDCNYDRDIVWVDTTLSPDDLWRTHLEHACRKKIKQAERAGVRILTASSDDHIREFYRVYRQTMERNEAEESYYLSYEFFQAFRDELPENARFVLAEYRDQIVGVTLCLYDSNDAFTLFGGADAAFQHVRPTNAVFWDLIRWAHETGKKRLVLGGGYRLNDGIFRFKAGFSRLRQPFFVYKRVHLGRDYAQLEERYRSFNNLNGNAISYFPAYRCPANEPQRET